MMRMKLRKVFGGFLVKTSIACVSPKHRRRKSPNPEVAARASTSAHKHTRNVHIHILAQIPILATSTCAFTHTYI